MQQSNNSFNLHSHDQLKTTKIKDYVLLEQVQPCWSGCP